MSSIMITQEILELESLCQQLYNASSAQQIHEANKLLENFSNSTDCLSKCQILLDRGVVRNVFLSEYFGSSISYSNLNLTYLHLFL